MYSRREVLPGRFIYVRKKNLEKLWNSYRVSKKRNYNKLRAFRGSFPEVLEKHFSKMDITVEQIQHAKYEDYESEKDKAIRSIGNGKKNSKDSKYLIRLNDLRRKVGKLKTPIQTKIELCKQLDYCDKNLRLWAKIPEE